MCVKTYNIFSIYFGVTKYFYIYFGVTNIFTFTLVKPYTYLISKHTCQLSPYLCKCVVVYAPNPYSYMRQI